MVNPTIGMEIGETYTFLQTDRSNYMHPVGFAYFPDGAHDDKPELEPAVAATATQRAAGDCVADASCPAPMYFSGDEYLGVYSNIPEVKNVTSGEEDFGLDAYEPLFFISSGDWAGMEPFSIKLRFDDEDHTEDIFYFCHVSNTEYRTLLFVTTGTRNARRRWGVGDASVLSSKTDYASGLRTHNPFPFVVTTDSSIHVGSHQAPQGRTSH
jgi:hypothetical protein